MKDRLVELKENNEVCLPTSTWYDLSDDNKLIVSTNPKNNKYKKLFLTKIILVSAISKLTKKDDIADQSIETLQEKISAIRTDVKELQQCTTALRQVHTSALMSLHVSNGDEAEMKNLTTQGRTAAQRAAKHLAEVENCDIDGGPAIQRMLAQQTSYARLTFSNAMEQFEKELQRYSDGLRKYVAKQIAIVGGDPDPAHAESCIEEGKIYAFVDNYQLEEQQARDMLEAVTHRQKELAMLEATIVEVHDLFAQTALLIAMQGSVIDNIEMHVNRTVEKTAEGRKQLKQAGKKKRSALKKKAILGTVGGAVAVGLITAVAIL